MASTSRGYILKHTGLSIYNAALDNAVSFTHQKIIALIKVIWQGQICFTKGGFDIKAVNDFQFFVSLSIDVVRFQPVAYRNTFVTKLIF